MESLVKMESFYYVHHPSNQEWTKAEKEGEATYNLEKDLDKYHFNMNEEFFFLYNQHCMYYYQLTEDKFHPDEFLKIDVEIGAGVKYSSVKGIHCGSDPRKIVIVIDSTIETDLVIEWNLDHNTETNSYDVGKQYDIFFDSNGEVIVKTNHHFMFNGTILKAFNAQEYNFETSSHDLGLYHGHRFDHNNHNWIINK